VKNLLEISNALAKFYPNVEVRVLGDENFAEINFFAESLAAPYDTGSGVPNAEEIFFNFVGGNLDSVRVDYALNEDEDAHIQDNYEADEDFDPSLPDSSEDAARRLAAIAAELLENGGEGETKPLRELIEAGLKAASH